MAANRLASSVTLHFSHRPATGLDGVCEDRREMRHAAIHLAFAILAIADFVATPVTTSRLDPPAAVPAAAPALDVPSPVRVDAHATARPRVSLPSPFTLDDPRGRAFTFRVKSALDPGHGLPNAWVYVPRAFDLASPTTHVTIIFHGWQNCIASYVSPRGAGCLSGALHTGYDVAAQVERSGIRSLVVVPQLAYEVKSSEGGPLAKRGGLRAFLTELVEETLEPVLGARRYADVDRVALVASSGGWQALIPALVDGGVDAVRDVYLLDAYYFREPLTSYLLERLDRFDPARRDRMRFGLVFCLVISGSARVAEELGETLEARMRASGRADLVRFRKTLANPTFDELTPPISVVSTLMDHDEVVRKYLWQVLAASGL